jgi:hypothetical protein
MLSLAKHHGSHGHHPMLAGFVRQIAGVFGRGSTQLEGDAPASDGTASELDFDPSDLGSRLWPSHRPPAFASVDYAPRWG